MVHWLTELFRFRRFAGVGLLTTVFLLSSSPAYAYYGIAEYVSALVTLLVAIALIIYGATLGLIFSRQLAENHSLALSGQLPD